MLVELLVVRNHYIEHSITENRHHLSEIRNLSELFTENDDIEVILVEKSCHLIYNMEACIHG